MSQTRRLAAILAADVAGYSRLMGADEEGTLERLVDPLAIELRRAYQPGHRLSVLGDDHLFTLRYPIEEARQMRLCFEGSHRNHV